MHSREDLQRAAAEVIGIMKSIHEYSHARVAVIGGLALWTHLRNSRTTQDVDFIININTAPGSVKQKLLDLPQSPFRQRAQVFFYVTHGNSIQIDITPHWQLQSPYLPEDVPMLKDIPDNVVPFISPIDLIVFKINSCGLRAEPAKKFIDANDAEVLLEQEARNSPLLLTLNQQICVENTLADVLRYSSKDEEWWRLRLGLPQKRG